MYSACAQHTTLNLAAAEEVSFCLALFAQSLAGALVLLFVARAEQQVVVPGAVGGRVGDVAPPGRGAVVAEHTEDGLVVRGVCGGYDAPLLEQAIADYRLTL